jgi:all-trans-retinol 13,14-reductase
MDYNELSKWEDTKVGRRGDDYKTFKEEKAQKMITRLDEIFPGFRKKIKSYNTATPLTLRDYTGTYRGSLYGIERNSQDPNKALLFSKTKVPNLFLTGQNLSMHGMLGVSMGALLTCAHFCDLNELLLEINHV